ncbi:glycosyltransferase family 2 protein [Burkholderia multivorans]|uniref:glycosyltransferase family 2 protein n=1 Tax=Burkholderia multivorans TaxID=87883 RepID=UPI001C23E31F|nr:glycosyltransferase family 2 protein [Burkholderia multivorans]MBU9662040.1 glycosyltransferase family 2 protein [Burkholderia multivorans]
MSHYRATVSISIVVYYPDEALLRRTIETLSAAIATAADNISEATVYMIDNREHVQGHDYHIEASNLFDLRWISGHGNVGYGRAHNLAIERTSSDFHVVLNPDVELDARSLREALAFFEAEPELGLLAPSVCDAEGKPQFLCRRIPTLLDLFVRGFLPPSIQRFFAGRLERYEMRELISSRRVVWDPPIVSGCFMMFRTATLKSLGGFDPRYFLYFEDYDLSLRVHGVARVAYVPAVHILHHGGGASRKGFAHIRMFIMSAFKFFNRFGWRWW